MKIRIRTIVAGPNGNFQPGDEPDVDDDFGKSLIDGGYAELAVEAEEEPEKVEDLGPDYTSMKKGELISECESREIDFPEGARKTDLIGLLEADDNK